MLTVSASDMIPATDKVVHPCHPCYLALAQALDPQSQGICWPDPLAWDGRTLQEAALDLLALADSSDDEEVAACAARLRACLAGEVRP